jgi:ribosomal protein L3
MRGMIGKKVGMTQVYDEQGIMTPRLKLKRKMDMKLYK